MPLTPRLSVRNRTCLAETVALLDTDLDARVDRFDEFLSEWCGAAVHHAQAGQVVFVDDGVFAQEQDDGGNDVTEGDAVVLDVGAPFLDVEFLHHDKLVAAVDCLMEEAVQSIDVVEWEEGQYPVPLSIFASTAG